MLIIPKTVIATSAIRLSLSEATVQPCQDSQESRGRRSSRHYHKLHTESLLNRRFKQALRVHPSTGICEYFQYQSATKSERHGRPSRCMDDIYPLWLTS